MKRLWLVAASGAALALPAWSQVASGTYQFTSGPGVGTPAFTVNGATTSLGGSVSGPEAGCAGTHVHGTFNGFADTNPGGCGHGIIQLVTPSPAVSGGALPGGAATNAAGSAPTNLAGQLALISPAGSSLNPSAIGDAFLVGVVGFAASRDVLLPKAFTTTTGLAPLVLMDFVAGEKPDLATAIERAGRAINAGAAEDVAGTRDLFRALEKAAGRTTAHATEAAPPAVPDSGPTASLLRTTLAEPVQRAMSSPVAMSWLEDFAAYDDRAADGYRRDADKTRQQAGEWRKLADDARRDAERNRERAADARRAGREGEARDWEQEAGRDEARAGERDENANRLDGWSDEARRREQAARDQARDRREAAERAREQVRQAERDRAERQRRDAEEKARVAREEREARQAKERAEREARIRELEDRVRAREQERARQRADAERAHRAWLAEEQARRDARARGSSSDADLAAAARKKKEEEEKTWADLLFDFFDSSEGELVADKAKDKVKDAVKDKVLEAAGITELLDDAGLDKAAGKLGDGIDQIRAVKKLGDSMEAELRRQPGLRSRIESRMEAWSSQRPHLEHSQLANREMAEGRSGQLYGREMFGTAARMIKENQ